MIEISNVDQVFRVGFWMKPVQVLHGIHLKIPEKSVFGFLGANGAGKSTTIHLIIGLRKPSRGMVKICGHHAASPTAKSKIGYLPERPYFHDHLTGEGLLRYFGTLSGLKRSETIDRIPKVLSQVGMTAARSIELKKYSKGMLQRIGIAQALIHDPELLVFDEPMSGLDPSGRKEIRELIEQLASEGRTVLFSSHVIPDVEAICDQVAIFEQGRVRMTGSMQSLVPQESSRFEILLGRQHYDIWGKWDEWESIREIPDGFRGVLIESSQMNQVLKRLLDLGVEIRSATPIRPSLEDFFSKEKSGIIGSEGRDLNGSKKESNHT